MPEGIDSTTPGYGSENPRELASIPEARDPYRLAGRFPEAIEANAATPETDPVDEKSGCAVQPVDTRDPPESPVMIPFLVRGHRSTVGPHGETVWEPAHPPVILVPLVSPTDGWETVESYLVPSLPPSYQDRLPAASPSGGYARDPAHPGREGRFGPGDDQPPELPSPEQFSRHFRYPLPVGRWPPFESA